MSSNLISRGIVKFNKIFHELTSFMRAYPDFLILGNSFCCKTLLYNYMIQHPLVMKNLREETAFWVEYYEKGKEWYKSNFPTILSKKILKFHHKQEPLIGETVNIPLKVVPYRIHQIIKKPKIIVILRNPIERSYARYLANVRAGIENKKFEDALEEPYSPPELLKQMEFNEIEGNNKKSIYHLGSIYYYDLLRWNEFFPIEEMLFLTSEELINDPLTTTNKALKFLNLDSLKSIKKIGEFFEKNAAEINPKTRNKLQILFEPYNIQLFDLIGKKLNWV